MTYEQIPVTTLASGFELFIPLHRLQGASPGPTLGLSAVVHGDEPLTNEMGRRVLAELEPPALHGTLPPTKWCAACGPGSTRPPCTAPSWRYRSPIRWPSKRSPAIRRSISWTS